MIFEITNRENRIGKYMDRDIYEFITIETGQRFAYESIAVINPYDGSYYVNKPGSFYILINGNLLYREIV